MIIKQRDTPNILVIVMDKQAERSSADRDDRLSSMDGGERRDDHGWIEDQRNCAVKQVEEESQY